MDDDDDLMRDLLGTGEDDTGEDDGPAVYFPARAISSLEQDITEIFMLEMENALSVPMMTFEDEDPTDEDLLRNAAINRIAEIEQAPVAAKWTPRIEIARALGPNGTRAEYEAICQQKGIDHGNNRIFAADARGSAGAHSPAQ